MKKLNNREARQANGGGYCCTICGYGREAYRSKLNVAGHILRKHFGVFAAVYSWNIYKYRHILGWAMGL